jgi:hypothetical protein
MDATITRVAAYARPRLLRRYLVAWYRSRWIGPAPDTALAALSALLQIAGSRVGMTLRED